MSEWDDYGRLLRAAIAADAAPEPAIAGFLQALRTRSEALIRSRVAALEAELRACQERADALEKERDWQREGLAALEKERDWHADSVEQQRKELATLQQEWEKVTHAHDELLAHHSELVARCADEVSRLAATVRDQPEEAAAALARLAAELKGGDA